MKSFRMTWRARAALASSVLATALSANAEPLSIPDTYLYVGGHVSQYYYDYNSHFDGIIWLMDDVSLPGLQGGYRFNSQWSAQLWWEKNGYRSGDDQFDGDISSLIASARYHFSDVAVLGFEPYLGVAAGNLSVDTRISNDETVGGGEFGAQRRLRPHWIVDLGARLLHSFDNEHDDGEVYIGLNYLLGGGTEKSEKPKEKRAESTPPPPAQLMVMTDADGDGIADIDDQCPDTQAGAVINEFGCEPDSDGDLVKDSLDQCPNTPRGAGVDRTGCMLDSDKDGIADTLDQCDYTPAGAKIDDTGCRVRLSETLKENFYFTFDTGTASLSEDSDEEVGRLAALLRQYPDSSVTLVGHTDNSGASTVNQTLSEQRAQAVRDSLISLYSIAADRVMAFGKGESDPMVPNSTPENRAKNRRVEVTLDASKP